METSRADKLGVHHQRPGDADALALAAGKFVGIAIGPLGIHADLGHDLSHPRFDLLLRGGRVVENHRLFQGLHDGLARVQ